MSDNNRERSYFYSSLPNNIRRKFLSVAKRVASIGMAVSILTSCSAVHNDKSDSAVSVPRVLDTIDYCGSNADVLGFYLYDDYLYGFGENYDIYDDTIGCIEMVNLSKLIKEFKGGNNSDDNLVKIISSIELLLNNCQFDNKADFLDAIGYVFDVSNNSDNNVIFTIENKNVLYEDGVIDYLESVVDNWIFENGYRVAGDYCAEQIKNIIRCENDLKFKVISFGKDDNYDEIDYCNMFFNKSNRNLGVKLSDGNVYEFKDPSILEAYVTMADLGSKDNSAKKENSNIIRALKSANTVLCSEVEISKDGKYFEVSLTPDKELTEYLSNELGVPQIRSVEHKPYTFENIEENGFVRGIDVSQFNGKIDWNNLVDKVNPGFVIMRAYTVKDGAWKKDKYLERNFKACSELGIPIGIYTFFNLDDKNKTLKEVNTFLETISSLCEKYNVSLQMPIYIDYEGSPTKSKNSGKNLIRALNAIGDNGYYVGYYADSSNRANLSAIDEINNYDLWLSRYMSCDSASYKSKQEFSDYYTVPTFMSYKDAGVLNKDEPLREQIEESTIKGVGVVQNYDNVVVGGVAYDIDFAYNNYPEIIDSMGKQKAKKK